MQLDRSVVLAGRFKGELRAKDVLLEEGCIFDGNLTLQFLQWTC